MSNEQEMREAFERWFKDYSDAYDIEVGSRNYYAVMKAWNAATLAAEARIRHLEEALTAIGNMTFDTWTNGHEAGTIARAALTEHKENQV